MKESDLIKIALEAKKYAYAPYSHFYVGAALLTLSGKVYTGVNVENASYGATNCAERTAVFKAVSEGEKEFSAIAVVSDSEETVYPCGICRQVLLEFGGSELKVLCGKNDGSYKMYILGDLLPYGFEKGALKQ